jgi:hypothetical protein
MNLQREFIKRRTAYYLRNPGPEPMDATTARKHAAADAQWLRERMAELLQENPTQ